MKKVYQTCFGSPGGNCFQASVASLMELPLAAVPDFPNQQPETWWEDFRQWCIMHGWRAYTSPVTENGIQVIVPGWCMVGVRWENRGHSVVGKMVYSTRDLMIVHDPNPSVTNPCEVDYEITDIIWIVKNAAQ